MMRQHGHGQTRGAANLHGMGVSRTNTKMLGEYGGQHDVRRDGRIAAEHAVDLAAFQPGIGHRERGGPTHEVERGRPLMPSVGRQSDAGNKTHVSTTSAGPAPSR